jgi:hypothetical protein
MMMESKNGSDYAHNYDVIVKWMAEALRGETLEVLGVKTGIIEEVFGFEPADISVKTGSVDVMARDETGALYHIEEQRNLCKSDMYRFAAYHFLGARQWGNQVIDIILASGKVFSGEKMIITGSGKYTPMVIDFSERNGLKRLEEIRNAVRAGTFTHWMELIFLPLYGKESGRDRSDLVEQVIRFETEMYHAEKISARLLAATLIMSNKLIDKERIEQIWEEIKMLDIIEIAEKKGMEKGKAIGIQEMVIDALIEKFNMMPERISERVRKIENSDVLKSLFRQILKCQDMREFEIMLDQI